MSIEAVSHDRKLVLDVLQRNGLSLSDFREPPSTVRLVGYIVACWGLIVLLAYAALVGASLWLAVLLFLALGIVQHAMINVVHEASHYSLTANRTANELIGDLFFALPLGITVDRYRLVHEDHHRELASENDPSGFITDPSMTRGRFLTNLLTLLVGRAFWDLVSGVLDRGDGSGQTTKLAERKAEIDRIRLLKCAAVHLPVLLALWWFGAAWLWLCWVVSAVTLLPFLDGLRTTAEHRFAPHDLAASHTRSHHKWLVMSHLCAPVFQYHWEHHLFPMVPHHQLRRLHFKLIELGVKKAEPVKGHFFGALISGLKAEGAR